MRRRRHEDYVAGMGYIGLCPGRLYRMTAGESYDLASVSGSPVVLESSVAGPLEGLTIYGWSKQDGVPSPGNPAEIVSAGSVMTTGAQMFDSSLFKEATASGVAGKWLPDEQCFLLNGTATSNMSLGIIFVNLPGCHAHNMTPKVN